jgi:hypothetical protein
VVTHQRSRELRHHFVDRRPFVSWHQTWVDNQGAYLDFTGEFGDGKMILSRHATVKGQEILQRMVWSNITPDSFDWSWERSDDDGTTWKVLWPLQYVRKPQ